MFVVLYISFMLIKIIPIQHYDQSDFYLFIILCILIITYMCDLHCTGFEPDLTGLQPIKLSTAPLKHTIKGL